MHVSRIAICLALTAGTGCFSSSNSTPPASDDAGPGADAGESPDATMGSDGGAGTDAAAGDDASGGAEAGADGGSSPDGGCGGGGSGTFSCTGSLVTARSAPGGGVLSNGTILVAGGWNSTSKTLKSAELYDPASGTFAATGGMANEHLWSGWASPWPVLTSGKVLVAGGLDASGALLASAELYDPAAGMFSLTGPLGTAVVAYNAVKLQDGSALFLGGYDAVTVAPPAPSFQYTGGTNQVQRYDPTSGMFAAAGMLAEARLFGCNLVLPSGKLLAIGGWQGVPTAAESNIEQYDPVMNTWSTVGALSGVTCSASAFNLPGGAVLLDSSNLLDPMALTTTPTTNALAISSASFVQLANGDVLAFGGQKNNVPVVDAEVYRNATGLWTAVGSMHEVRQGSRGFLMANGDVLVVGGASATNVTLATAEIYHP